MSAVHLSKPYRVTRPGTDAAAGPMEAEGKEQGLRMPTASMMGPLF